MLVGARFDLFKTVIDKARGNPTWTSYAVQLTRRQIQSNRTRPAYASLVGPTSDLTGEPAHLMLGNGRQSVFAGCPLRVRCVDPDCPMKVVTRRADEEEVEDIPEEDRAVYDPLAAMMDEGQENVPCEASEPADGNDAELGDMWPFARHPSFYSEVLQVLGKVEGTAIAVIYAASAHPGAWLATRDCGIESFLFTRKWPAHSRNHGGLRRASC